MTGRRVHPPRPIMVVLDVALDALLGGSHGWMGVPPGGYLNVTWLPNKQCYRLTIDVTTDHPLEPDAGAFLDALRGRIAALAPPVPATTAKAE